MPTVPLGSTVFILSVFFGGINAIPNGEVSLGFPLVVFLRWGKVMAVHLEAKVGQFFSHQPHKLYCTHAPRLQ